MARISRQFGTQHVRRKSAAGQLPLVVAVRPSLFGALFSGVIGLAFVIIAVGIGREIGGPGDQQQWIIWIAGAVGAFTALKALVSLRRRMDIRIDGDEVAVSERRLLGTREWTEPLSAYEGVRWQTFQHSRSSDEHDSGPDRITYTHLVELAHPDDRRTVPLFREVTSPPGLFAVAGLLREAVSDGKFDQSDADGLRDRAQALRHDTPSGQPREAWEGYARLLGLPAIDARDGAYDVRAAEDVDKSLQERAREGSVEAGWSDDPPPETLEVETIGAQDDADSQELRVKLHASRLPLVFYLLFGGGGLVFLVSGLIGLSGGSILFGLIFAGAAAGIWYLERRNPREIRISRSAVSYVVPNVSSQGFSVPLSAIESVRMSAVQGATVAGRSVALMGRELVISTDGGDYRLAAGLPRDALDWLRRYLVSAIATA